MWHRYSVSCDASTAHRDEVGGAPFEVSPEDEAQIVEAIAEADRGEVISAAELFRRLSR